MSEVKDYMKVIITALITALVTLTVTGVFTQNAKVNESATKLELTTEIKNVKKDAIIYTDAKISQHEEIDAIRYTSLTESITETKKMVKYLYELEISKNNKR